MLEDKAQMFNSTQKMFDTLEGDFIAIGGLLHEIKNKKQFKLRGYVNFKEYIELELNTAPTFANKLIRVYDMFVINLSMSEMDMKEIGFEKFSMVYPIFSKNDMYKNKDFLSEWSVYLQTKTISELKRLIKQFKEKKKELDIKSETIKSGWERAVTLQNVSKKELLFQLAVMFLLTDTEYHTNLKEQLKGFKKKFELQVEDAVKVSEIMKNPDSSLQDDEQDNDIEKDE